MTDKKRQKYKNTIAILFAMLILVSTSACNNQESLAGTYTMTPGLIGGPSNEIILMKDGTGMISTDYDISDLFTWEYVNGKIYFMDLDAYRNTIISGTVNKGKQFIFITVSIDDSQYELALEKTGPAPKKLPELENTNSNDSSSDDWLNEAEKALGDATVYWSPFGRVYHTHKDCQALNVTEQLYEGTVKQAIEANRTRLCRMCAQKDGLVK